MQDGELVEVPVVLDVQAPAAARALVARCLRDRVVASALDSAQLLVSELMSNSLRHSGVPVGDEVLVSVELASDWFRIGVVDSGSDAVIAVQPASMETGGGFGLNLVQLLSERWGVERRATGGTQVWAQLARAPLDCAGQPRLNGARRSALDHPRGVNGRQSGGALQREA